MNGTCRCLIAGLVALVLGTAPVAQVCAQQTVKVDIVAQPLADALRKLGTVSNTNIIFEPAMVNGLVAPAVKGEVTPKEALVRLLAGTQWTFKFVDENTVSLVPVGVGKTSEVADEGTSVRLAHQAQADQAMQKVEKTESSVKDSRKEASASTESNPDKNLDSSEGGIPEILVKGKRSVNADIKRTEDDILPYVTFDREQIERSQAVDLENFLKSQLPMNTAVHTLEQIADSSSDTSGFINLRGLGVNQTLILVDGRRLPGITVLGEDVRQPSISGIALSSIERIEVLPATASAIYGGGATGGVINIIRKRDYSSLELGVRYAGDFRGDTSSTQINATGGVSLEGGRTHLTFSASHSEAQPLLLIERDFGARARALALANGAPPDPFLPPRGTTPNICSAFELIPGLGACNALLEIDVPLTLDDGTELGSAFTSVPAGYSGPSSDEGAALAANAGRYNFGIPNSGEYLLRSPVTDSASAGLRREFGTRLKGFLDLSADRVVSDLSSSASSFAGFLLAGNPANPFQQDIAVNLTLPNFHLPAGSESEILNASAGLIARLSREWTVSLEHGWSQARSYFEDKAPALAAPNAGGFLSAEGLSLLNSSALQDLIAYPVDLRSYLLPRINMAQGPFDTRQNASTLRLSGPAFRLPAGDLRLAGLVERRKEDMQEVFVENPFVGVTWYPERSRTVSSYYLESNLPIVKGLDLQASIRRDEYEIVSTRNNPTAATLAGPFTTPAYFTNNTASNDYLLGLRYAPTPDVTLRASFATGFLPPSLSQISPRVTVFTGPAGSLLDPKRGNTPNTPFGADGTRTIGSGNPGVRPEESENWSAGVKFTPRFVEDLRLSLDYTRIRKTDEISSFSQQFFVLNEAIFPERVVRAPLTSADIALGYTGGVITELNASAINLSKAAVDAYDLQFDYIWRTQSSGALHFSTVATRMERLERQLNASTPSHDSVGYFNGPLKWKGTMSLGWEYGPWVADWSAQYFDSYSIGDVPISTQVESDNARRIANQGSETVPSQVYHDLFVRFKFAEDFSSFLNNTVVSAGIQNLFDTRPPILVGSSLDSYGADNYSQYGDPRLRRFSLTVSRAFGQ